MPGKCYTRTLLNLIKIYYRSKMQNNKTIWPSAIEPRNVKYSDRNCFDLNLPNDCQFMGYQPKNKIRIVTAASLFDGHDAAINIMRRILQSKGAEIIHLGHNRSVHEIVECAIEEDVQGIAITSYQGGHVEFFKYMKDLLDENGCGHIKIFGGGGGTILPQEIKELQNYGITRIYSPDDGRKMGLEGMIEDVLRQCDVSLNGKGEFKNGMTLGEVKDVRKIAREITNAENGNHSEVR